MRGISEALEQELENDGMYLEEVLSLLKIFHHQSGGITGKDTESYL